MPLSPTGNDMTDNPDNTQAPDLMTADEAAAMLKMKRPALLAAARAGRVPAPARLGGPKTLRWDRSQVTAWIAVRLAEAKNGGGAA